MSKFIALLRGINVGGYKKIKMADLRSILEKRGLQNVETYIQSGNIVFSSTDRNTDTLARQIEGIIEKEYGFHVPTIVLENSYLVSVLDKSPFLKKKENEIPKMYFGFLYTKPESENIEKLMSYSFPNEQLIIDDSIAYAYYGAGAGKAKLTGNFIENKLKVTMSTRNYNTVLKLIEMSKD